MAGGDAKKEEEVKTARRIVCFKKKGRLKDVHKGTRMC
jgi:hypothetical protein